MLLTNLSLVGCLPHLAVFQNKVAEETVPFPSFSKNKRTPQFGAGVPLSEITGTINHLVLLENACLKA